MKAANFDYVRAGSLSEICELLGEHGGDAKLIAGGQSLVPMLAMRLTKPALLIDLNDVQEIKGITTEAESLVIGGGTRQHQLEESVDVERSCPLIRKALYWVGHPQTRNRGTLGGSLVHADPSAELPLVSVMLDAEIMVQGADGEETLVASEFFLAPLVTALPPINASCACPFQFGTAQSAAAFTRLARGVVTSPWFPQRRRSPLTAMAAVRARWSDSGASRRHRYEYKRSKMR
jgi:CO/xanthine dehydrogenase FAD-binding subunit